MFKTQKDAEQFAEQFSKFVNELWSTKKAWDGSLLRKMFSESAIIEWQGAATVGIEACLKQWKPVQKAIATHSTLGCDLDTFSDNMASFRVYISYTRTWLVV